jgi:hypothetical protein
MSLLLRTVTLLSLLAPTAAFAGKVVLTPLVMDPSVTAKQRLAVHQLIASELDFAPEVDGVVELDASPPTLDDACLASAKCLSGIAAANGATQVVTGRISASGANYALDIVFFDGTKIARRKTFTVPQDSTALANAMTPIVHEVLTGAGPKGAPPAVASHDDFSSDDEVALGGAELADAVDDLPPPRPAPAPVPKAAPAPVPRPAPPPPPPAPAPRPPPAPSDDELAKMISFGGSVNDITAEQLSAIKFAAPPPSNPEPMARPAPAPAPSVARTAPADVDEEDEELDEDRNTGRIQDLDGGRPTRTSSSKPPSVSHGSQKGDIGHVLQLTARGGFTKYYKFNFLSGGGEAAVAVYDGLHLMAGMEVYGVKRVLPPDLQVKTGIYSQWNYIFPMNVGLMYKFPLGMAQPYVGADMIFVQYYKDAFGADWAGGGRVRTGADFMVIPNFGFNVNLAVGAWTGQNWGLIEQGVGKTGLLPEISAGTVFAF